MAGKTWKKTKLQFLWQHRKYGTYYARFHRDGKQHRKSLKTDVFGSPKRRSPASGLECRDPRCPSQPRSIQFPRLSDLSLSVPPSMRRNLGGCYANDYGRWDKITDGCRSRDLYSFELLSEATRDRAAKVQGRYNIF
jgi:hypothetical protein